MPRNFEIMSGYEGPLTAGIARSNMLPNPCRPPILFITQSDRNTLREIIESGAELGLDVRPNQFTPVQPLIKP